MTKRRDRTRAARRRKRVYVYRWTSEEDPVCTTAARILTSSTKKEPTHETLRTRGVRRSANTKHL